MLGLKYVLDLKKEKNNTKKKCELKVECISYKTYDLSCHRRMQSYVTRSKVNYIIFYEIYQNFTEPSHRKWNLHSPSGSDTS